MMIHRLARICFVSIVLLTLMVTAVTADNSDESKEKKETAVETDAERDKTYMKIGSMTVTATSGYLTSADAPGSVDVIGADQLENENVDFTMQALKKLPGVF